VKSDATLTSKAPQSAPKQLTGCHLVENYGWDTKVAYAICMAESGGNARSYNLNRNGTVDKGLMQINSCHSELIAGRDLYDPKSNLDIAYEIYRSNGGFKPWVAYNSKSYKKYL